MNYVASTYSFPRKRRQLCFPLFYRMRAAMKHDRKWDRRIMGAQYFLYFGMLGMFLPYFNLYCFHLGFSGVEIGILSALRSLGMIVFPIAWGIAADRLQARRPIYIFCSWAAGGIWALYLFRDDFVAMFWITLLYGIFFSPLISFMEAFTMDVLGEDKQRYGRIRAWGTTAFIAVVILLGRLIDAASVNIILGWILAGSFLQAIVALPVPDTGGRRIVGVRIDAAFLFRRDSLIYLASAFMMLVSHGAYYGFFSIHLTTLGYGKTFIGTAWALASTAEIFVMLGSDRIFRRFPLENILMFSLAAAVLRWVVLYQVRSPAAILASQTLHAATYAAFHIAGILYVDRLTPTGSKTLGQAVNNAVTYGLGMTVGFFLSGWVYDRMGRIPGPSNVLADAGGAFPLFLLSAAAAGMGILLFMMIWMPFWSRRRRQKGHIHDL